MQGPATAQLLGNTTLGANTGGNGTLNVTGAASAATIGQQLLVGNSGTGILNVQSGGFLQVTNGSATIAVNPGSTGTLTVTGANSTAAIAQQLAIGGTVSGSTLASGGAGTVNVTSNGFLAAQSLYVIGAGGLNVNAGGTVAVGAAGSTADGISVNNNGLLGGTGTVNSLVLINPGGRLALGAAGIVGTLFATGQTTFNPASGSARSTYLWDIANAGTSSNTPGGSNPGSLRDLLSVSASLSMLDPIVSVQELVGFLGSFNPAQPYSWTIAQVTGGGITVTLVVGPTNIQLVPGTALANAVVAGGRVSLTQSPVSVFLNYQPVPEPAHLLLLAAAAAAAWRAVRKVRGRHEGGSSPQARG